MKEVFFDPKNFFERTDPGLSGPIMVVAIAGLASLLASALPATYMTSQLSGEQAETMRLVMIALGGLGGFIAPFLIWGLVAGFGHVISIKYGGTGEFAETATYTAWGFIPFIIGYAFMAITRYAAVQQITPPSTVDEMQVVGAEVSQFALYRAGGVIIAVLTLWSAFIWAVGVHESRGIELREAMLSIAVPVVLVLSYQIYQIF